MSATELPLMAPLTGPVIPLDDVPDPVFAGRMMGDGVAIEPLSGLVVAPCDGVVTHLHRAGHALTLTAGNGAEILVHIGIDTVNLNGRGFTSLVHEGERVRTGDRMIAFDVDRIAREVACLHTLVVIANGDGYRIAWRNSDHVQAGTTPLMRVRTRATRDGADAAAAGGERSAEAVVAHAGGLHARPAALVQAAARYFDGEVSIDFAGRRANAASVVALMALGTHRGDRVTVRTRGPAADAALTRVVAAIEKAPPQVNGAPSAGGLAGGNGVLTHDKANGAATPPGLAARSDGAGLPGIPAAPGLAVGRVVRLDAADIELPPHSGDVAVEYAQLAGALGHVRDELVAAICDAEARATLQQRDILAAHAALLDDPELCALAERAVGDGVSAGEAFRRAVRTQCKLLSASDNPLVAERVSDLRELEQRVLSAIAGYSAAEPELFDASILVADELAVSQLTRLPRQRIAGLCTARGGATSHVAILARAFGVPALVAMGPALLSVTHGKQVLLDAGAGRLDPAPDAASLAHACTAMARRAERAAQAFAGMHAPALTRDGHCVEVAANVASGDDASAAIERGADGVGLVRTELLFMDRDVAPTEAEQRDAYQALVATLAGRPVIIRTFDAGSDKPLRFCPLVAEPNPALGLRGIRTGLVHPELLDAQLRALLAVRPLASCRILLPMVADAGEIVAVRRRLETLASEAGVGELPQLGVMIEVPSAAVLADQLAQHADFLSLGTNDLTQYVLAMDRCHPGLAARLDGLHPAVLRLVAQSVEGAARHDKWVGVCGALASDLEAVPVLVGLGVRELSVSPSIIPELKERVRSLDAAMCRTEARALLDLHSPNDVRARIRALWPEA
ncbi:MAG TPA: phosphoenolpyruvate--protein phosphotransferase [Polyangia bacterium]|nr:phosphoenolpyruvate--protein phosphotransferase [Polyangia bacterium]